MILHRLNDFNSNKNTFLFIVVMCLFLSFQLFGADFYVDNSATGSNNGTSWANAWESFSAINWSSIQPGDIIYISGGTSSKTYNSSMAVNASGSSALPILITKGIDTGHNGEVILQGSSSGNGISINNRSYVTISNLTLNNWSIGISIDGGSANVTHNIIIDNCDGVMGGRFVFIQGHPDLTGSFCHDITVRNCDVTTPSSTGQQNDFVYAQYMAGLTIENNYANISSNDASQHNDCIQTFWVDGPVIVRNNYFEHSDTKTRNSQGIFFENHEGDYYVYNNIVVMPNSYDTKIYWKSSSLNDAHTMIYGNTVYGLTGDLIKTTDPNAEIKNNILYSLGYQSSSASTIITFNGVSGSNADVSNNLFYDPQSNMTNMNSGTSQNSLEGNPLFTNISNRDFTLQTGSPAIDAGVSLGSPYNVDMLGTTRPQGSAFDIGSYEVLNGGGGGNNPPNQPTNANPANGSTEVAINVTLGWTCTDPDGNPLTYDVYFGTSSNPSLVSISQTNASFNPGQLNNSTIYYWKVIAKDNIGAITTGPIWNFTTENAGGTDLTLPELVSASLIDSVTLNLLFSEQMNEALVEDPVNYSITSGINIINVVMTGNQVRLFTSNHTIGTYQVTVNNVTDLAGNIISTQNNSQFYEYQSSSGDSLQLLPVIDVLASVTPEPNHYGEKTLDGKGYFDNDPDSRWAGDTMPEWLVYDFGDVQILNQTKLSFYNWNTGRIYNYSLQVSIDSINWNEIRSNIPSLSEEWSIVDVGPLEARYLKIIFIANNQSAWAGLWEAEFYGHLKITTSSDDEKIMLKNYSLEQNYPNPFNPSTIIMYRINNSQFVSLKVYDILGNEVASLVNEQKVPGNYEVEFKADNLASGVYLYRLQTIDFIDTKKMILLR